MLFKKRGQVSFEYIMVIGVALILLLPLFYYTSKEINEKMILNQADDMVNNLISLADNVYSLGVGNKATVWITVPGGTNNVSFAGKQILINHSNFGIIHKRSLGNLTGYVPSERGTYLISAETLSTGFVRFNST